MDHAFSNPSNLESFYAKLRSLEPFLIQTQTLQDDVIYIAHFLSKFLPICHIALIQLDANGEVKTSAYSDISGDVNVACDQYIKTHLTEFVENVKGNSCIEGDLVDDFARLLFDEDEPGYVTCYPVMHDNKLVGFCFFAREDRKDWSELERKQLEMLLPPILLAFISKEHTKDALLRSYVFNSLMENTHGHIFVSDPQTDKILFMSSNAKNVCGIENPEGRICWQVLQKDRTERCELCPVDQLLADESEHPSYTWEEENSINGRFYENYDSLIRWIDGSIVHFQHSVDVTESKNKVHEASMDELTGMFNRRVGKLELEKTLKRSIQERQVMTVCMYDVNSLKKVNDAYGHIEGDFLISTIANTVKFHLGPRDYPFRLSGDEFIVVFPRLSQPEAEKIMDRALESLREKRTALNKPYDIGFCYGTLECQPEQKLTVSDILRQTDARMYEQKRKYHIIEAVKNMTDNSFVSASLGASFTYDRERLYDALVKSTDDYIFVCNMKSGIFHFPPSMIDEFDFPGEFIENAAAIWKRLVHPDDCDAFLEAFQEVLDGRVSTLSVEYRAQNRKGEWIWLRSRGYLAYEQNGEPSLFAGMITNLGKKNKVDHITGLFNKHEFEEGVNGLLVHRPESPLGIMIINLDEFRRINDLYDREFGDEILRITAHKIQAHLPPHASLYRMDGDEFAVLFRGGKRDELQTFFNKIRKIFDIQQEFSGKKYFCTISAGAALYPMDAINYLDLYKYAGYSLEYAKARGKGICFFFSQEIMTHKTRVLELTELLRESVERNYLGFSLNFQPQVDAATNQVNGAEALVRWDSGKYGPLSPIEFIPLLEKSGLIHPVGRWILRQAIAACKPWIEQQKDFTISINLSYLQVVHPDFIGFLEETLAEHNVSPANLILELTETLMTSNIDTLSDVLRQLRNIGIRIAMDDFGTGYSSLDILKMNPADIVKIDRMFVRNILSSNFDATFIKFIVALCHDVNIQVCLEGVESMDEYSLVKSMDLDIIQGYLFGHPLTEVEFQDFMSNR